MSSGVFVFLQVKCFWYRSGRRSSTSSWIHLTRLYKFYYCRRCEIVTKIFSSTSDPSFYLFWQLLTTYTYPFFTFTVINRYYSFSFCCKVSTSSSPFCFLAFSTSLLLFKYVYTTVPNWDPRLQLSSLWRNFIANSAMHASLAGSATRWTFYGGWDSPWATILRHLSGWCSIEHQAASHKPQATSNQLLIARSQELAASSCSRCLQHRWFGPSQGLHAADSSNTAGIAGT